MSAPQIIKYEGDNKTLVYKFSCDDLTTKSQLIVNESQEAIFYKSGQALDLFGAGRHPLTTENLPIIKRIFRGVFGGGVPFPCEVFFINKVSVLDVIWGTDTPIELEDPKYNMVVSVAANGQTGIKIIDSRRFVVGVVGQLKEFNVDTVRRAIKGMMISAVKESIAAAVVEQGISILDITAKLGALSENIMAKTNARIADLGLELNHFSVDYIGASDSDVEELKKIKAEAAKITTLAGARKRARELEGFTYQEERQFDILEGAAKNEGATGGFINMGVGMGVGVGIAGDVSKMASDMRTASTPQQTQPQSSVGGRVCPQCGASVPMDAKFCMSCGAKQNQAVFCPNCGRKNDTTARFCPDCGTKLI
ncbi:MAG: SPFH domain-containing protein [Clostridiales bacterium]|nr:SPFH domain-containing protein [Clostridiales bacterium]